VGWSYDAAGNLLNDGAHNYQYDPEGRIRCMDAGANCANPTASYVYSVEGRRVKRTVGGATTLYLHDGGSVLSEFANPSPGVGTWQKDYIYLGGALLATESASDGTRYHFSDHLGTPRVITDAAGNVVSRHDYYPYGTEITAWTDGETHKFTGKERDTESNLDYFGARYYASTLGRFTSTDPKGIALRHLLNPQKLNKYSYVLNNPLSLFDPNGMEEVTITFRTFIPQKSVAFAGRTFAGDNRGFSTSPNASSRTFVTVRLETDASKRGNPIISVTSGAGATHQLDANGSVVKTGTATTGLPTATGTRDANGNVVLNIEQAVKNPLTPQALTPAIDANFSVTVPQDASSVSVKGTIDDFPAAELNVTRADGNTTAVIQHQPPPGATPLSLFPPDKKVDVQKPTPQCSTDEKGKKVCSQ
jgi:RHS repeat-associated protein